KRDRFCNLLAGSRFELLPCKGTYFQLASYKNINDEQDTVFAETLTKQTGVASIPISVFYNDKTDNKFLRFCFAKEEETLEKAAEKLCKI
ncbi:MAG: aminotransferase class I/II-fold pyridoxal phosphate-dependent enzyme, partial [Bacteroidetes bacterium]|nr:aminotransferase class I/II-fold pyridoxal phosphate-dependent enzyme [Bacteroidota bacterium]